MNFKKLFVLLAFMSGFLCNPGVISAQTQKSMDIEARVTALLRQMTLEEKVAQMMCFEGSDELDLAKIPEQERGAFIEQYVKNGMGMVSMPSRRTYSAEMAAEYCNKIQKLYREKSRLGIPVIIQEEGLHGYQAIDGTVFPSPLALASTWNPELVRSAFDIAGKETRLSGGHMVFTPVLDLGRDPRWGRTEETYGEDPYLVSRIAWGCVTGYQGEDAPYLDRYHVAACLKHYTAHGSSEGGRNTAPTKEDERTIMDICQYPFKYCVQQGKAMSVMASYQEINGVPVHASYKYLTEILKKDWGFDGVVVSDWHGVSLLREVHHLTETVEEAAAKAVNAGVEIETPNINYYKNLADIVRAGMIPVERIDDAVRRILRLKFRMGLFDEGLFVNLNETRREVGNEQAREVARAVGAEGIVLLKNDDGLLPLSTEKYRKIALIGPHADFCELGNYSGTPKVKVSTMEGVKVRVGNDAEILFAQGVEVIDYYQQGDMDSIRLADPGRNRELITEAVEVARRSDIVVLCLGGNRFTAREGWQTYHRGDNATLELRSNQNELVEAVLATGKPVVVLLFSGYPNSIEYISEHVPALMQCWYLGQETGHVVASVLFGDVNPSGKLPISVPKSVGQLPVFYNYKPSARYRGYIFESAEPRYVFGYGLSYTTFSYKNLKVTPVENEVGVAAHVSIDVTNTGRVKGRETVQLYIRDLVASITRPVKELRGFEKIELTPGETRTVNFTVSYEDLAFHDIAMNFIVEPGEFEIMVGPSSAEYQSGRLDIARRIDL